MLIKRTLITAISYFYQQKIQVRGTSYDFLPFYIIRGMQPETVDKQAGRLVFFKVPCY